MRQNTQNSDWKITPRKISPWKIAPQFFPGLELGLG